MRRPSLKILHVGKFLPPSVGGMERALQSMASGIAERGHEVRVLVHQDSGVFAKIPDDPRFIALRVGYRFAVGTMPISWAYFRAYHRLSRWADIVHFHEPFPPATLIACLLPRPAHMVISWHSDIVRQRLLKPLVQIFQRRLCRRAARIICSTAYTRDDSRVLVPWRSKCAIIGFGLDPAAVKSEIGAQERVHQEVGGRFVLAVGRLVYYKGFDILLRATALTETRLVIVGRGPLEQELKQLTHDMALDNRVVFAGAVDDRELADYYSACDFFVLPSTHRAETFGIVQIEAMARGKPVINTALPTGVPDVSLDGVTGITVQPGDAAALAVAMSRLWDDAQLRDAFGARARARVEQAYGHEATTSALEQLYLTVMAETAELASTVSGSEPDLDSITERAKPSSDKAQIV